MLTPSPIFGREMLTPADDAHPVDQFGPRWMLTPWTPLALGFSPMRCDPAHR